MSQQEIQQILDGLDMQLASGKLDLETYRRLTDKWKSKQAEGISAPTAEVERGQPPAFERVACPECGAPLEERVVAAGTTMRCQFCRATFTLRRAQEQTEKSSLDLQRWLAQLVADAGGTSMVDTASRGYIFREKLLPALMLDYRRGMEPYEDALAHPLVTVDLLESLPGYRAGDHVLVRNPEAVPRMRSLSLKTNSPLLANFAVAGEDRDKLREMEWGATSLVYLANAAQQLGQPGVEALVSAKDNLIALKNEYVGLMSAPHEAGHSEHIQAICARLDGDIEILDVLASIFAPDAEFAAQVYQDQLNAARTQLERARSLADASPYHLGVASLKQGLERDERILALIDHMLSAYRTCSGSRAISFVIFYRDLKNLLKSVVPQVSDIRQLDGVVEQVPALIRARRGEQVLHLIDDWSWRDAQIENGRKRPIFGAAETVGGLLAYWHPYWWARVRYTSAKGTFMVSGVEQTGWGLVDALSTASAPMFVLPDFPLWSRLSRSVQQLAASGGLVALPAVQRWEHAERVLAAASAQMGAVRNVRVTVEGVVYVPVVKVQYRSSAGVRMSAYAALQGLSAVPDEILSEMHTFTEKYA